MFGRFENFLPPPFVFQPPSFPTSLPRTETLSFLHITLPSSPYQPRDEGITSEDMGGGVQMSPTQPPLSPPPCITSSSHPPPAFYRCFLDLATSPEAEGRLGRSSELPEFEAAEEVDLSTRVVQRQRCQRPQRLRKTVMMSQNRFAQKKSTLTTPPSKKNNNISPL